MSETIFTKIINKEIPADIVFESKNVLAFRDINPQAPVHILIIPKTQIPTVKEIEGSKHSNLLGEMYDVANKLAIEEGISENGFRIIFNCGDNGGRGSLSYPYAFTRRETNEVASRIVENFW